MENPHERKRLRERQRYADERAQGLIGRTCIWCAGPIPLEMHALRKTCSDECRTARNNNKSREYYFRHKGGHAKGSPEWNEARSELLRQKWAAGEMKFKPRSCRCCGETFTPASPPQRYCSPECKHAGIASKRYGVPAAELHRMLDEQGNVCAICGEAKKGWAKTSLRRDALVIDHCHNSGRVRGFLCGDCNTALGRFNDDPARLRAALAYLERDIAI
jgi:hypothetical protein